MFVFRKSMLIERLLVSNSGVEFYSMSTKLLPEDNTKNEELLSKLFSKPSKDIKKLLRRQPLLCKYDHNKIMNIINTCQKYSIDSDSLLNNPKIFGIQPITIENHCDVLLESGFREISPSSLLNYVTLVSKKTINQLKSGQLIERDVNVQEKLQSYLSSWPTSPAMSKMNYDDMTLYKLRMKILSRYMELNIDLPVEDFERKLKTYPRIKHRPLRRIDELLDICQHTIGLSNKSLCSNFALFQANPENVKMMLKNISSLSGINLRDFIMKRPSLLIRNWENVAKVQKILNDNNIPCEAQRKCFDIFCLDYKTVAQRLEHVKSLTEYSAFMHHPKIVKLILSKTKADVRLKTLRDNNKQCASINVLSGTTDHYLAFAQSQGDLNNGNDAKAIVRSLLQNQYSYNEIKSAFQESGYINMVPVENFKIVYENIKDLCTNQDVFENCCILLFPWEKIRKYLEPLICLKSGKMIPDNIHATKMVKCLYDSKIDVDQLTMSTVLSLVLYFIEKEYHFNGGGIWNYDVDERKIIKQL